MGGGCFGSWLVACEETDEGVLSFMADGKGAGTEARPYCISMADGVVCRFEDKSNLVDGDAG